MARQLRIEYPDALYHVTSRGNGRQDIFLTDEDRLVFLAYLAEAVKRFGWLVSAWVLMTNHFHLVIQTPQPNLSRGMQWLNGSYAAWFNQRHGRCGHLFQGRFHSLLIDKQTYFAQVLRYVVLNPVRARMVDRPENYRWSSFRAMAGLDPVPEWFDLTSALEPFGGINADGWITYREFVEAGISSDERLWDHVTNGIYLGTEDWTRTMRQIVESKPRSSDFPLTQRAVGRPKMADVVNAVAKAADVSIDILRSRHGKELRRLAACIGWNEGLLTLSNIAAALRLRSEGYISSLIRRCTRELDENQQLLAHLDLAVATLRALTSRSTRSRSNTRSQRNGIPCLLRPTSSFRPSFRPLANLSERPNPSFMSTCFGSIAAAAWFLADSARAWGHTFALPPVPHFQRSDPNPAHTTLSPASAGSPGIRPFCPQGRAYRSFAVSGGYASLVLSDQTFWSCHVRKRKV